VSADMSVRELAKPAGFAGLAVAGLLFVDLILSWQSVTFGAFGGYPVSRNGIHGFGVLTLLALIVVVFGQLLAIFRLDHFVTFWAWLSLPLALGVLATGVIVGGAKAFLAETEEALPLSQAVDLATKRGFGGAKQQHLSAMLHSSTTPMSDAAAEGWYDDPSRPGQKRWWDGESWGMTDDDYPHTEG
jgi:hypothetical protein